MNKKKIADIFIHDAVFGVNIVILTLSSFKIISSKSTFSKIKSSLLHLQRDGKCLQCFFSQKRYQIGLLHVFSKVSQGLLSKARLFKTAISANRGLNR